MSSSRPFALAFARSGFPTAELRGRGPCGPARRPQFPHSRGWGDPGPRGRITESRGHYTKLASPARHHWGYCQHSKSAAPRLVEVWFGWRPGPGRACGAPRSAGPPRPCRQPRTDAPPCERWRGVRFGAALGRGGESRAEESWVSALGGWPETGCFAVPCAGKRCRPVDRPATVRTLGWLEAHRRRK